MVLEKLIYSYRQISNQFNNMDNKRGKQYINRNYHRQYQNFKQNKINTKKRPNWFLSIPIDDQEIKAKFDNVQKHVECVNPGLREACVPIEKSHLTLFVFYTENIEKVNDIVSQVIDNYMFEKEIKIEADEIGHFSQQVIFSKLSMSAEFQQLWQTLADALLHNSIISPKDANFKNFKPHLTLMKLSKINEGKSFREKIQKIPLDMFEEFKGMKFGSQFAKEIQLLSRDLPVQENGNYYCMKSFKLNIIPNKDL